MKKSKYNIWILAVVLALMSTGCSSDTLSENGDASAVTTSINPGTLVLKAFYDDYQGAEHISWSIKDDYYVADFSLNTEPATAWYSESGELEVGKTSVSSAKFETAVSTVLSQMNVSGWQVKGAHQLDRKNLSTIYQVEVTEDNNDINVYFTQYGDYIKTAYDSQDITDEPIDFSSELSVALQKIFSNAVIVDVTSTSFQITNVGILDGVRYKVVSFDADYSWVATIWDLHDNEIPDVVVAGFKNSKYGSQTVNNVKAKIGSNGLNYLYYFEQESKNVILTITEEGRLTSAISY
ncbi:hypothetical protein M2459_001709 [Parabacteroides sp. PF5-5]|uniref:PepSY-like domain-containing protein n=1 Tax=unclassified Parabacteroides TaxID=2649774 RepID=UPI0024742EB0|nr:MULTISPECIES: PepSY-like domain-containing protein [unclassified Parabacteroides]MDH6304972.1 hypothetical protein [Parabacteroides sp. PH5-39]MDH6315942.1 hypothetical protein [Parabacteroides sp. PF5-13]MDH6319599.1 hypothetical protein [Parabacteroides sp. PH5-13]MDH6323330.1 hypothetical protein [Parabacteroides sp. PH5-8]MDH6327161.1 hypothetical protein [Parabacteroides sp. PH5-41]